jgi:hypothetical protein
VAFRSKRRTTRGPREENIWPTLGYIMDAVGSSKIFEYPYFVTAAKLAHVNKACFVQNYSIHSLPKFEHFLLL